MALRSVLNRLPAPLRKRAYGLTAGGAAYKARVMKSRGLVTASKPISPLQTKLAIGAGVVTVGCVAGQTFFGSEEHFYDHRFVTEADPNALAEFYGNEDFMEIFCVFPFMVDFMMRSGYFDDNGHVHTFGLPPIISNMVVSMQFDEREEEDESGEANTVCFNKKERFKCTDALFGNTLWEMVQNFGYATREDGKIEVYHYGQKWSGPFFIRLIFQMHARYVIWATEQHVNSPRFLAQDEDEEDDLVAQRHNIPKHLLGQFLDGLDVDVQAKLNTTLAALQQARSSEQEEEVKELLGTVQRLEGLVAELQAAKLKRAKTMVEAPLQRRVTEGGPSQKMGGSARGLYQRALVRRATAVEGEDEEDVLQRQTTDLSSTIEAALEEAEEVVVPVRTAIVRRLTAIEDSMKEEEDEVVSVPLKRHSTLNRRTITSIVNSEEDAAAPELMEAAREIEVEAAPEVAVVAEAAPAPEAVVEAPVVEEEGPVAALVRRVTEQIQEAVEAKTEASQASATESDAPVRRKTQLSLHVPGYAPYGYGYPPHPYQYAPPQPYAPQAPPQGQMPPPPPYPYYYAPPPPPHGYWAPPHAPMTVPQGAYYPGATASSASSASVSSASQTE